MQLYPQPATKPWPPVLMAGSGTEASFLRIIECGDGWIPPFVTKETIEGGSETVAHAALARVADLVLLGRQI